MANTDLIALSPVIIPLCFGFSPLFPLILMGFTKGMFWWINPPAFRSQQSSRQSSIVYLKRAQKEELFTPLRVHLCHFQCLRQFLHSAYVTLEATRLWLSANLSLAEWGYGIIPASKFGNMMLFPLCQQFISAQNDTCTPACGLEIKISKQVLIDYSWRFNTMMPVMLMLLSYLHFIFFTTVSIRFSVFSSFMSSIILRSTLSQHKLQLLSFF